MLFEFFRNDVALKLAVSLLVGGLIGAEREYRSKSAGLRTFTLICLGCTILTILSGYAGYGQTDRIAANIITGIGFLGAGVIFKTDDRVQGLTTAAIIWVTASLGMAVGEGHIQLSLLATLVVLGVMVGFKRVERMLERSNQTRHYRIVYLYSPAGFKHYRKIFKTFNVSVARGKQTVGAGIITGHWTVRGKPEEHEKLIKYLLNDHDVKEFDF